VDNDGRPAAAEKKAPSTYRPFADLQSRLKGKKT
jgi:hypothetical protein